MSVCKVCERLTVVELLTEVILLYKHRQTETHVRLSSKVNQHY